LKDDHKDRQLKWRHRVIGSCDVALAVLVTWQAVDALRPATVIATGLVLGVRTAAVSLGMRRIRS
jgi:hypothetical protein